jgi:hypothetical protein
MSAGKLDNGRIDGARAAWARWAVSQTAERVLDSGRVGGCGLLERGQLDTEDHELR